MNHTDDLFDVWNLIPSKGTTSDHTPTHRSCITRAVRYLANAAMAASLVAGLAGVGAEAICLTIFFLVWILRIAGSVVFRWLEMEPDTVIYFAPWVSESQRHHQRYHSGRKCKDRWGLSTNTKRSLYLRPYGPHTFRPERYILRSIQQSPNSLRQFFQLDLGAA